MTWNVNGLLDKIKKGAVLRAALRAEVDILLLQETHLLGNNTPFLARVGFGSAYHSGFVRGSRGVGILIRRWLKFQQARTWHDKMGRYVGVTGTLGNTVLSQGISIDSDNL